MKTVHRKRRRIRWGRVFLIPALILFLVFALMTLKYSQDQKILQVINDKIVEMQNQLEEYLNSHKDDALIEKTIIEANAMGEGYAYEEALAILRQEPKIQDDPRIKDRIAYFQNAIDSLVNYDSPVRHLFFHNLIIDPSIAFGEGSHNAAGYNSWNITVYEFKRILEEMYARGFVVVDFYDVYEYKDGKYIRKPLKLPEGKIPFIFSIDDMSYPDPKPADGFARGLTLKNGEIYTRVETKDGEILTKDGDIVPILEIFLEAHPDFSYKNARGILALSGHAGTLGFRLTNNDEIEAATQVVEALKSKGWIFANHSYSHADGAYYSSSSIPEKIDEDFAKWTAKIGSIAGDTTLFVAPFGYKLTGDSLQVVKDYGYSAYFIVDRRGDVSVIDGMTFFARVDIDGVSMTKDAAYLNEHFFDVQRVLDPARP